MALPTDPTLDDEVGKAPGSPTFLVRLTFDGDDSYATGGSAGFQAMVRLAAGGRLLTVVDVISGNCGDNKVEYNRSGDLLFTRVISTGAQVANAADLSSVPFNVTAICE